MIVRNDQAFITLTSSSATTIKALPHPTKYVCHMVQLVISAGSATLQVQASLDGGTTYTDLLATAVTTTGDIAIIQGRYPLLRVSLVGSGFTGVVALAQYGSGPGEVM